MESSPPRSSPPPSLPRDLVARARIQTERDELGSVQDTRVQVLLEFELGALYEHGLRDVPRGAGHYCRALEHLPDFRPALFALARLYADADQPESAATIWEGLSHSSHALADRAAALCEAGLLHHDRLSDRDRALTLWNEALELDPSWVCAALLLEQHHRATQAGRDALRAVAAHARGTGDPEVEAALLIELAAADDRAGDVDGALARLARAAELAPDAGTTWREIERIARRHGRHERVCEALTALALRGSGGIGRAAARLCEAGRLFATTAADLHAARMRYDRALELEPCDALALWESALLHQSLGSPALAAADARKLVDVADDPALAAAARLRLSELLSAQGDAAAAQHELLAAAAQAPDSAAVTAALEDALLRGRGFAELRDHLLARAERSAGQARAEHLLRGGRVALLWLGDPAAALDLMQRAADCAEHPQPMLRARWAAAVFAGDAQAAIETADRLCASELEQDERSLLRFDQYHRMRQRDGTEPGATPALKLLSRLLDGAEALEWSAQAARLHAANARALALLARAHRRLAEQAGDDRRAAAHLCAAARALAREGEPRGAAELAREALARAPDDAYALALLEECLLAAGDGRKAAEVLRQAARAHASGKQRELALLHAGAASEAASDPRSAARSYEEAAELDASSHAPRFALLRLAQRTRDRGLLLRALEQLAHHEEMFGEGGHRNLELGELLGAQGLAASASAALRVALSRADTRSAAAFELYMLPEAEITAELRDAALAALADRCDGDARLALLRDAIAARMQSDPKSARALLEGLLADHPEDAGLAIAALSGSRGQAARAEALLRLARAADDADASAELVLHGQRLALLAHGDAAAEDGLLRALAAAQHAPSSLAAAVALDEALWAGDDADSRASALAVRAAHASAETSQALRAAHARALLAAGRAGEAAEVADQALVFELNDLAVWELKRAAARARGDFETAAEAAERLAMAADGRFRTELLEEAAVLLQNELGQSERAERCLRAAFGHDPQSDLAFSWLHDLLLERRDLPGLLELIERRAEASAELGEQIELGHERALVLRALGRKEEAIEAVDRVLAHDPHHAAALGLKIEACTASERWHEAIAALQALAGADVPQGQKRLAHLGAADFLERRLGDLEAACTELEAVREISPDDPELLARIAGLYQRSSRYRDAAQLYARAAAYSSGRAAAAFERSAGDVLLDPLGVVGEAAEAYARALAADPLDAQACAKLVELLDGATARAEVLANFEAALDAALARDPLDPALLRKLRRLGAIGARRDREWIALCSLRALGQLDPDEDTALDALAASVHAAPAKLGAQALVRLAGAVDETPIADAARLVATALARRDGAAQAAPVGLELPPDLSAEQRFEAGAYAAAQQLGVLPLWAVPPPERRDLLHAALLLADVAEGPANIAALAKQLGSSLPRAQRKELSRTLAASTDPQRELDAYLEALERTCQCAGMLVADDPRPALAHAMGGIGAGAALELATATPRAVALLSFWVSPFAIALRRELGWPR